MRIRYIGPVGEQSGYAQAGHDYLMALLEAGAELDPRSFRPGGVDGEGVDERYRPIFEEGARVQALGDEWQPSHLIVHTIPAYAHLFARGEDSGGEDVVRVALTTWETDHLPVACAESLDEAFDLVVVPSWWNYEVFRRSGVPEEKLAIVPHTYDGDFWYPVPRPWCTGAKPPRPFAFYTIGVWNSRKNIEGLLKAYWHEFGPEDDVVLVVLCPNAPARDMEALVGRLGVDYLAKVKFMEGRLSDEELRQLHHDAHCYVSATRGEGWGLGAFEAGIVGNPVIMPFQGGQADFLIKARGVPLAFQWTPALPDDQQLQTTLQVGHMTFRGVGQAAPIGISIKQYWAEPDLSDLATSMRRAYEGVEEYRDPAMDVFEYRIVGPQFMKTLKEAKRHVR